MNRNREERLIESEEIPVLGFMNFYCCRKCQYGTFGDDFEDYPAGYGIRSLSCPRCGSKAISILHPTNLVATETTHQHYKEAEDEHE